MIVVMEASATDAEVEATVQRVESMGLKANVIVGTERTVVAAIGDKREHFKESIESSAGVSAVVPIAAPYKMASREVKQHASQIRVLDFVAGAGEVGIVAGPCSVEDEEQILSTARAVKAAGATGLRGGAFKPRTSPYSFQGLGEEGLKILREVGDATEMPVVTEVMDPRQVELVDKYTDILQVGARNMQNFNLLMEVGKTDKPVLLKRGMSATIQDLLMSAEYIIAHGNKNVILCERGIRSFDSSTRNLFDLSMVPNVKGLSHLPIVVDPSHATGRPDLIPSMALAGVAAGADGIHIEVHNCPEKAMSDGPQALLPNQFAEVAKQIRDLAPFFNKELATNPQPVA